MKSARLFNRSLPGPGPVPLDGGCSALRGTDPLHCKEMREVVESGTELPLPLRSPRWGTAFSSALEAVCGRRGAWFHRLREGHKRRSWVLLNETLPQAWSSEPVLG